MSREHAFTMSATDCLAFPWHAFNTSWHPREGGQPAVFGLGADVNGFLHRHHLAAALAMPMVVLKRSASIPLWTPCTNLAFTLCATRGRLRNSPSTGSRRALLHLATRGADIAKQCDAHVPEVRALRPQNASCAPHDARCYQSHDATWDECFVTKSEYCVLTRACANGQAVWNATPGPWECVSRSTSGAHL